MSEEINHQKGTMTQIKKVLYTAKTHSLPGLEREVAQALVDAAGPDVSVFQSHTRQRRRRDQPGLKPDH